MKKGILISIVILVTILVALPIAMDKWIIGNNVFSSISNEAWLSFFGGYFGAIITGATTFVAFCFTFFS